VYSGNSKKCDRKTVGNVFTKPVQIEGTTQKSFYQKVVFLSLFTFLPLGDASVCSEKIAAPMLMRVWQELYRIDVCRVTRGAHIKHL
jgi:hypothetical protein